MNDSSDVVEPSNLPQRRLPLGELLVMAGVLERAALKEALARQRGTRIRLGTLLVQMGVLTEAQITQAVAGQLGLHVVDLVQFRPREDALRSIPYTLAKEHGVLPLIIDDANDGGTRLLYAAFSDPTNQRAMNAVQIHTGLRMRPVMIEESTLTAAIDDYYMALKSVESPPAYVDEIPMASGVPIVVATEHTVSPTPEVMTLDAAFITPIDASPALEPWPSGAGEPALELATSREPSTDQTAHVETLDVAFFTPIELAPESLAPIELAPEALTPIELAPAGDPWPTSTEPSLELPANDESLSLDLDQRAGFDQQANAMDMYAMPLDLPAAHLVDAAAANGVADPFADAALPVVQATVEEDLEGPEEIDDAQVSALDDGDMPEGVSLSADLFDRAFTGFTHDDDDDASNADAASGVVSPSLPPISIDPFFADPLPSEIVTLAPDQLRSLISAAMERGSLDPAEVAAMIGDPGAHD
jgi:hypothetical protein